jgi:hypothetical protein
MKNINLISTDKPSRYVTNYMEQNMQFQNIYITSDEEIKMDDWYLDDTNSVRQAITECESYWTHRKKYQKIILTTDQDLIKDGVQAIDDNFLEWFVKNPKCEWVEVKKEQTNNKPNTSYATLTLYKYKIIIPSEENSIEAKQRAKNYMSLKGALEPKDVVLGYKTSLDAQMLDKEEPKQENCCTPIGQIKRYVDCKGCDRKPKQETPEEAAKEYIIKKYQKGTYLGKLFIAGAKWQSERMYSEEDLREAILTSFLLGVDRGNYSKELEDKLIEQFKKK